MSIFFAADHHLGHKNIITFKDSFGYPLRRFSDIETHDNYVINTHNNYVKNTDLVYFLGDIAWKTNVKAFQQLKSMNGRKRVCVGNHDDVDWLYETGLFERIYLWKYFPEHNLVASHVPLTSVDLKNGKLRNVHGHVHDKIQNVSSHFNVTMEATGYTPVTLDFILNTFG